VRTLITVVAACSLAFVSLTACGKMTKSSRARPGDGAVIFQSAILTMDPRRPTAEAVVVKDGLIVDVGAVDDLVQAYPGATFDERFLRRTLLPMFIDVRLPSNSPGVIEIPCNGAILPETIRTVGAVKSPVRVVAQGALAIAAAADAVQRMGAGANVGVIAIEARGAVAPALAHQIVTAGAVLVLSGEPVPAECPDAQAAVTGAAPGAPSPIIGRIAVAPRPDDDNYPGAAAEFMVSPSQILLAPLEALEAITLDAAWAIGAEGDRGSIAPGKRAAFAALDRNPLATPAEAWRAIKVETVDLSAPPPP